MRSRLLGARTLVACAVLALCGLFAVSARAQSGSEPPARDEADRPLATFSPRELEMLAPLLETGTVSLVEFADDGHLPAIVIATEVHAPVAEVARVIGDPRRYPEFMPALDEVKVNPAPESATAISYEWAWRTAIFTLRGTNAMERFAPPFDHPEQGWRFVVRSTGGDLGTGRTVWRILPRGPDRALLMSSSRLDLRDANYLVRQFASASQSVNRTIHIAIALAMVLRTRMEAERRVGHARPPVAIAGGDPERPAIDATSLEPLLGRGDVIWVETSGADLGRVAVIGAMHTPVSTTRAAILDPEGFTAALVRGARATVVDTSPDGIRFDWGLDLPLVGSSGQMRLAERGDGRVHLDGIHGAFARARWRFETIARAYGTLVVTWGRFDPADGVWLVRVVTEADAAFRPGLACATQLMMVRGLRTRLIRGI